MSKGRMFSFRVTSPRVERLLVRMKGRSRFVRDAVTEKLLASVDGALPSEPDHRPRFAGEPEPEPQYHPLSAGDSEDRAEAIRLRSGLVALSEASAALLSAGGQQVPEPIREGLAGISAAAAALATEGAAEDAPAGQGGGAMIPDRPDASARAHDTQPTEASTEPGDAGAMCLPETDPTKTDATDKETET